MHEFVGRNSIINLPEFLTGSVLILSRESLLKRFSKVLAPYFKTFNLVTYTKISPNPKKSEIDECVFALQMQRFDVIVAFGGGSVIDFAKAFKFYQKLETPLIAIPTTAGTGSESTQFAVIYVDGVKISLDAPSILPNVAIVDSQFIENSPQYVKAPSAMDAYCQAIESYWAKNATSDSRRYAIESIKLCSKVLFKAVTSLDKAANESMTLASHLAGKAINISRTTAAHALSYKLTSDYGIPHGHAVAICLPRLFKKNLHCMTVEDRNFLLNAIDIKEEQIEPYFHNLLKSIGLEYSCQNLGITDIDKIVRAVNMQRLVNNPHNLSHQDLIDILSS